MKGNVYLDIDGALTPRLLLLSNKSGYRCLFPFRGHLLAEISVKPMSFLTANIRADKQIAPRRHRRRPLISPERAWRQAREVIASTVHLRTLRGRTLPSFCPPDLSDIPVSSPGHRDKPFPQLGSASSSMAGKGNQSPGAADPSDFFAFLVYAFFFPGLFSCDTTRWAKATPKRVLPPLQKTGKAGARLIPAGQGTTS